MKVIERVMCGLSSSKALRNKKYPHGEKVPTSEPCLNCTCKKGVLLCFLRVCPALVSFSTTGECVTVREPGQCCPVLKCESTSTTTETFTDEIESTLTSTTTDHSSDDDELNITTETSVERLVTDVSSMSSVTPNSETGDQMTTLATKSQNRVTITLKDGTTVFQTNPTTVFHESPKLVTSSPQGFTTTVEQEDLTEINNINGDSSERLRSEAKSEESDARRTVHTTTDSIDLKVETETAFNDLNREATESIVENNLQEKSNFKFELTTVSANTEATSDALSNNDAKLTTAVTIDRYRNETKENYSVTEDELRLTVNASVQDSNHEESKQSLNESKIEEENSVWRSDSESKTNVTHRDRVEEILDGIIHALDKRLQTSLPAEPRLPLKKITEFFSSMTSKESQQALKRAEIQPVYTPNETAYVQASPYIPLNKYYSSRSQQRDDSYKETFEINPHAEYRRGSVLEDEPKVDIITAATPLVHNSPNDDSILVNLSPASFKVGSVLTDDTNESNHESIKPMQSNHNPTIKPQLLSFPIKYANELKLKIPKESLYYHGNIDNESNKSSAATLDKKARLDVEEIAEFPLTAYNNRMKYTPFGANDAAVAFTDNIHHKKNGSQLIRVPMNRNPPRPVNKPIPLSTSCVADKMEFTNGAMIPKSDPCLLCRCFYGRELCQQQKCPPAPRPDCTPEFISGFCCPRFTCEPQNEMKQPIDAGYLPFRKGPQFPQSNQVTTKPLSTTSTPVLHSSDKVTEVMRPENYNIFLNSKEQTIKEMLMQPVPGFPAVPVNVHSASNKRPPFPLDPTPRPYVQQLFGFINHENANVNKPINRVHFPLEKPDESKASTESTLMQPPKSESVAALVPPIPQINPVFNRPPTQAGITNSGQINRNPQPLPSTPQRQNWKIPAHFSGPNVHQNTQPANNSNTAPISQLDTKPNNVTNNSSKVESDINKHEEMKPAESMVNATLQTTAKLTTKRLVTSTTTMSTTVALANEPIVSSEKTTHTSLTNHWDLLRVSGCNIYGTFYKVDQKCQQEAISIISEQSDSYSSSQRWPDVNSKCRYFLFETVSSVTLTFSIL
ncbi:hypothetical protein B4U80_08775 [Leptotrombidium deliense]|uniref:VWFC domain-containing protein n=1 Tax=Leptotrombidium deliense TaxID=299467 RepID=A0A443SNZ6_9ACAR|nr:hypothetical protein B4U80_08775 [Leptotrombidium deliense]